MKKGLQLSAAAVLALSAITPVAAAAAENTEIAQGVYTVDGFTSLENFTKLKSADKGNLLMSPGAVLVIGTDAIPAELIIMGSDADIEAGTVNAKQYQIDNNVTFDQDKGIVSGDTSADLKVESVSAINGTQVTVVLSGVEGEVPASSIKVADSNGSVYAVTSVAAGAVEGEYLVNLGTAVEGKGTLTVEVNGTSATLDFDTTLAGTTLSVEVADEDSTLVADGADNTLITVKVLKDGKLDENFKGAVKFQSLKGAKFAKEEVSFDKGVAIVQVNSISSAVEIVDTIIATISSAENTEAVGKQIQTNLRYVPANANDDTVAKVFITYAESNSASEVFVKFNEEVKDFAELRKDVLSGAVEVELETGTSKVALDDPKRLKTVDNTGIHDVVQIDDNTVKFLIKESHYLVDNAQVKVTLDDKRVKGIVQESTYTFNLVDSSAPTAVGIKTLDNRTLEVQFTEALNSVDAQTVSNWVLNGSRLTAGDVAEIKVGRYNAAGSAIVAYEGSKDNRNYVTIVLTADAELKLKEVGKNNLLQAYNITDFAAKTDVSGQNKATTQEFVFVTPAKPAGPVAKATMDSVEQYVLEFDQTAVNATTGAALNLQLAAGAVNPAQAGEIIVERLVDNNGTAEWKEFTADELKLNPENGKYFIELTKDWTEIHDTKATKINYYTPKYDQVRVTIKKDSIKSLRTDVKLGADFVQEFTLEIDTKSPTFVKAEQATDNDGDLIKAVEATLDEPVKFPNGPQTGNLSFNDEGNTPSQLQTAGQGVPQPTFEFVSEDKTKTIEAEGNFIGTNDKLINIVPKDPSQLTAGKWTVIIRSISDDVGNTAQTLTQEVTIVDPASATGQPEVIWAAAVDNVDTLIDGDNNLVTGDYQTELGDVVFIQYGTEMSLDAIRSNIYQINDKQLPEGVNITSTEVEYATDLTGTLVRIVLPHTFLGTVAQTYDGTISEANMLNINKRLTDAADNAITGPKEIQLTYGKTADWVSTVDEGFLADFAYLVYETAETIQFAQDKIVEYSNGTSTKKPTGDDYVAAGVDLDGLTVGEANVVLDGANLTFGTGVEDAIAEAAADKKIAAAELAIGNSYEFDNSVVADLSVERSQELQVALEDLVDNADVTIAVTAVSVADPFEEYEVTIDSGTGTQVTVTVTVTVAP